MITHIFWDYNGTILDDVNATVSAVNNMLKHRGLPCTDIDTYTKTLMLPLEKYYESVGIIGISMRKLSIEFRHEFKLYSDETKIFDDFFTLISTAKKHNIKNVLFSSLYEKHLQEEVETHKIKDLFDDIVGMRNRNLGTKTQNAREYIQKNKIDPQHILFIGDLTSDSDMAKALGSQCILVPRGHNSKERCAKQGVTIYDSLEEINKNLFRT